MDSGALLDLLGNENRRRILRLLARKPCYVTEISEYIDVSPKAVIDHLRRMEEAGLVESQVDDQRRKYFHIAENLRLEVRLSPFDFGAKSAYPASANFDIAQFQYVSIEVEERRDDDVAELATRLEELTDLERELSLTQRWVQGQLADVQNRLADTVGEGHDRLYADVLAALADGDRTVAVLAERLDAPDGLVEGVLETLRERGRRRGARRGVAHHRVATFSSARSELRCMNAGDRVRVERDGTAHEGVLLPSASPDHLVVKLDSGYNVGVDRDEATVDVLESGVFDVDAEGGEEVDSQVEFDDDLPTVALISTGGTIASTVDYRTGAVTAQFDAEDVLRAVPDLAGRANYRGRVVANILSENMEPPIWRDLAEAVHEEVENGADGVVVMHGTDTMQYSASALSFMLDTPVPVVFTGSQRSADRPSSDNVMNAVCSVEAAKSDAAEVMVCMHASTSDDRCALHRGTRVRKNHTSRRDAFETVGAEPLGYVDYDVASEDATGEASGVEYTKPYAERGDVELDIDPALAEGVELLKFTPGMDPAFFELSARGSPAW